METPGNSGTVTPHGVSSTFVSFVGAGTVFGQVGESSPRHKAQTSFVFLRRTGMPTTVYARTEMQGTSGVEWELAVRESK
jgi:hypothetical protein